MKKLKWISLILSATVVFISILGCGGIPYGCDLKFTHGDWVIIPQGENECLIYDLSIWGKKKEILVVPTEIAGKKVVGFATWAGAVFEHQIVSNNLRRLYFLEYIPCHNSFYSSANDFRFFLLYDIQPNDVIVLGWIPFVKNTNIGFSYYPNIIYFYNFEASPNDGYYRADYYSNEELEKYPYIKYQQDKPSREGYEFDGWYKEPECINKWNFETDKLPMDFSGAHNPEPSVKLYAKWIEI